MEEKDTMNEQSSQDNKSQVEKPISESERAQEEFETKRGLLEAMYRISVGF